MPKNPVTLKRWRAGFFVLPVPKAIALFQIDAEFYIFMNVTEAALAFGLLGVIYETCETCPLCQNTSINQVGA